MSRIFNFSAGPAVLPELVLKEAQAALWDLNGSGIGVCEHSHRGKVFDAVLQETVADCRKLAGIPDNYHVLFLQGGASLQFAMVPMNLLPKDRTADFLVTGAWSQKAVSEAKLFGKTHEAASSKDKNFNYIPKTAKFSDHPAYVHFTSNNTIFGTQWAKDPETPAGVPVVCDASSDIFSRPIDVKQHALIYAGAQKNLGPSGVTLVIIRDDLVQAGPKDIPTMLQYRTHSENDSCYNTPPTFGIYLMGRVFKWLLNMGGLAAIEKRNREKAGKLYAYLDQSQLFKPTAEKESRSQMNVTFVTGDEGIDKEFIGAATKAGFDGLKGHRSVGGMRASIYNAFPTEGVEALVQFMREFEQKR